MSQDNPYAASRPNYQDQFNMTTPNVPDYLVWSILLTLCCCPPLGIVGIVFSVMANSAKQQGDFQTAMEHAKKAKLFLLIGLGLGLCLGLFQIIIQILIISQGMQ